MARRLLICGNFSIEVLDEGMGFWVSTMAWPVALAYGGFNALLDELQNPGSELNANADGFNVLVFDPDDPRLADAGLIEAVLEALARTAAAAARPLEVAVLHSRGGDRDHRLLARLQTVEHIDLTGPEQIERYLDAPFSALVRGAADDAHVPFARSYWLALGLALARRLDALLRPPRKVLVLDCDDTLWAGVVGEDGVAGIRVEPAHRALHRRALALARQGWLLCLNSKNDDRDVRAVFASRDDLLLSLDDFSARRVNWRPKVENLLSLGTELDLGLDTFVFVDDNPLECARVRSRLPEVITLRLPERGREAFLDSVWPFDAASPTREDTLRAAHYRDQRARAELRDGSRDFAAFVASMELEIDVAEARGDDAARISQLTYRTNQFNATGLKLSAAEARQRIESGRDQVLVARVRDRFGDYGLVGACLASSTGPELNLDGFYVSCRALGRGVEHAMCAALGRATDAPLRVAVTALLRNEPARRYFARLAARHGGTNAEDGFVIEPGALAAIRFDARAEAAASAPTAGPAAATPPRPDRVWVDYESIANTLRDGRAVAAAIDARVRSRPDLPQPFVAPAPGLQRQIAAIWARVLHLEPVGCDDEFELLGGRSIQLVEIHRQIRQRIGRGLELTDLFRFTTVRALAEFLDRPRPAAPNATQERARRQIAARRRLAARRVQRHG